MHGRSRDEAKYRVNLEAIELSLRDLQQSFPSINQRLKDRRDELDDEVIGNILEGYAFVDAAVASGVDMFAMGNLSCFLELNTIVLCGTDPLRRAVCRDMIEATSTRFYEQTGGGIRDIVEWYALHRKEDVWRRAAGIYIRVLSEPQLFIEGNHRTGGLIVSYILASEGYPPFVLTKENAKAYFDPSSLIKRTSKHSLAMLVRMPRIKKRFAKFLKTQSDKRYIVAV